ncbi:MAG: 2-C-methyl-D-erythritol 2,4-cyclodiphosphate synthase [Deltaproteobacteria bacterium]|nr:2-C-methyl-D-erythritol 2,4-cyclodiphosphate synthase [Deltaproteobacteria bacterium]
MRVGIGYDIHRLVADRPLILGGVTIPFEKGLLGHSDADVLVHAVCDALLGAAGLGDIGHHFPDTDPRYKDIDSMKLLAKVRNFLKGDHYRICNIDAVIFAQEPRMAPHRDNMAANIAETLDIDSSRVNIKATTTEGLGFIGTGEGVAASAVALIEKQASA